MKRNTQLLGAVSAVALVAMSSAPAMAEGIRAGTEVTNTVTVTYDVGGVAQTPETATDVFAIDRSVNIDVTFAGVNGDAVGNPQDVAPGQTGVALLYDVTNLSNDTVDLDLNATILADANSRGTVTAVFVDDNNNGLVDTGEEVDFMANVLADETRQVTVLVSVDSAAVDAETFQVDLNANAFEAGTMTAGGVGTELVESAADSADQAVVDTSLVDGNSGFTDDAARDGSDTDRAFVEVAAANVSVFKSSVVVSDPLGSANPKAIPGAVIRYCIAVQNSGSGATATSVSISDSLPGEVDFNTGTIERNVTAAINSGVATCTPGSGDSATDSTADADGGGYDSGTNTVSGNVDDVVAGTVEGFMFEVTIAPAVTGTTTDAVTTARNTPD